MWLDVVDLRDFYASSLGLVAARAMRARIRSLWPDVRGERVLGLGYASPCLQPFQDSAERVIAAMPAAQGVVRWPRIGSNQAALVDELDLPFPDNAFDRILLVHAVEHAEALRPMLREVWRVLADSGRVLAVVPSRRGIWARLERTPFGYGHPYSMGQLSRLLRDSLFLPTVEARALYVPPSRSRMVLGSAPVWEKLGSRLLPRFAGIVMVEAAKQLYAPGLAEGRVRRRAVAAAGRALGGVPPATSGKVPRVR